MHSKEKFNAAIIGAGNIGAFYDSPKDEVVLTHAHAYSSHPHFELCAFVDTDILKVKSAAQTWGGRPYETLQEAMRSENIDVVSVCVPDEFHYPILQQIAAESSIKGGIIEKPLTGNLDLSEHLLSESFFIKRNFLVNYSRRYIPEFQHMRDEIKKGTYGKFVGGSGFYGKGLIHNGSHMLDLLLFLGIEIEQLEKFSKLNDFTEKDPSYSVVVRTKEDATFVLSAVDSRLYTMFEANFLFEKIIIRMLDSGKKIETYTISDHKHAANGSVISTSAGKAMEYVIDNLHQVINGKAKPHCTIEDGYAVERLCLGL